MGKGTSLRRLPQDALPWPLGSGSPLRAKTDETGCMAVCMSVWPTVVLECFPGNEGGMERGLLWCPVHWSGWTCFWD